MGRVLGELYADKYELLKEILELTLPTYDAKGRKNGGLTIEQACAKIGINRSRWYAILDSDPSFKKMYDENRKKRKDIMIDAAMQNVDKAIAWEMKLRPIDQVNVSMRFLEKTSDDFKDRVELSVDDVIGESLEELQIKASLLLKSLSKSE